MKKIYLFALVVFFVFLNVSCGTQPPAQDPPPAAPAPPPAPPPPPPPPPTPSQAKLDELGAATEKAENARERAFDFYAPSYFPGEWEDAETLYAQAGQMPVNNDGNIQKAIETYNAAADSYDTAFSLTIPLVAQWAEDEIMSIRGEVISLGVRDEYPEYFTPADEEAVQALEQYEAEDYYPAKDSAEHAYGMYDFMIEAYGVWLIREDILGRGFEVFSPDDFNSAEEYAGIALDAYLAKEDMEALLNGNEAARYYITVLEAGRIPYRDLQRSLAVAERQAALNARADIAVGNMFAGADSVFNEATRSMGSQNHEVTARGFFYARNLFAEASAAAAEKRRIAAEAIREAEVVIDEVIHNARQAELNRGGSR